MKSRTRTLPLEGVFAEYVAVFEGGWKPRTKEKYEADYKRLVDWLEETGRPVTTESLDFATLLAYVGYLKTRPAVAGVWRGDRAAVEASVRTSTRTLSLNSVNGYMRAIKSVVLWARDQGMIDANPFGRMYSRGKGHPLLPSEDTPQKGATLGDLLALERGCKGSDPLDLRDQAIVSLMKTTGVRNSSVRLLRLEDVDIERNLVTFRRAKGNKTFLMALQPETKAAILRYLNRARKRFLARYPVRGFEAITVGPDPGWLFLASDNGYGQGEPLTVNGLSDMLNRRYHAGGGTLARFGSHRVRHGVGALLANNGMGLDEVSRYYAHSSTEVTKRYAPQTPEALGQAAADALRRAGLTEQTPRGRRRAG